MKNLLVVCSLFFALSAQAQEGQLKNSDSEKLDRLIALMRDTRNEIATLRAELKELKEENKELKIKIEELEKKIMIQEKVIADLQAKAEKSEVAIAQLQADFVSSRITIMNNFIELNNRAMRTEEGLKRLDDRQKKDYEKLSGCLEAVVKNVDYSKDPKLANAGVHLVNALLKMFNQEVRLIPIKDFPELGAVCRE